jgi:hypothetical protein
LGPPVLVDAKERCVHMSYGRLPSGEITISVRHSCVGGVNYLSITQHSSRSGHSSRYKTGAGLSSPSTSPRIPPSGTLGTAGHHEQTCL